MGTVVVAVAMTFMTFGTALPPKKDCSAMTVDNGVDRGGSWDCGEVKTMDVVIADGRFKDADPQGGACRAMGAVDLNCGNGRGIAGMTTTRTTMRKQTSLTEVVTMAIAQRPSPKRQKIVGRSRKLKNKSSDDSTEGEDCQWHRVDIALLPLLLAPLPSTQSLQLLLSSTMPLP